MSEDLNNYTVYEIDQNTQFFECQHAYIFSNPELNLYIHQCEKHKELVCDNSKCPDFIKKKISMENN